MNMEFENKLFAEIEEFFTERGTKVFYDDIEGKKALVMEFGDEGAPEDCTVSLVDIDDNITAVNIMFTIMSGLPDSSSDDMDVLLPYLNKYLTVGNFGLMKDSGYLYFSCAFVVDEFADMLQTMTLLLSMWEIADNTAREGIEVIAPVIGGTVPAVEAANDDSSIIQF